MSSEVEVPRTATRWTNAELLAAYAGAWRALFGTEPSREALAILWGQASLECGRGGASCWQHNVGNIRGTGPGGAYVLLAGAYEFGDADNLPAGAVVIAPPPGAAVPVGKVCYLLPSKAQRFRAYASFEEGCLDKLALLRARWPPAVLALMNAATSGVSSATVAFVAGLRGYFTGEGALYTRSTDSLARECLRTVPPSDWPTVDAVADTDPAPAIEPGLQLGDERRTEWSHKIDPPSDDD